MNEIVAQFSDLNFILLLLAAFVAGFIDSIVGGGGLIQLPAFFLAFPTLPVATVLGSNKFAAFLGTSAATVQYLRKTEVNYKATFPAIVTALIFSIIGANLILLFDKELLKPVILILLVAVALYTFFRKQSGVTVTTPRIKYVIPLSLLTGAVLGLYDGFFGPGTGTFLIIIFVSVFQLNFMHAAVSAKLVNVATNFAALALFMYNGVIRFDIAIPLAVLNITGSLLGARLALKKGSEFIRVLFLIIVSLMILRFAYDVIFS
jgi:uncharacterized membrane protein YfcA